MKNPYLFDLVKSKPAVKKKSGTVQGCNEDVFPIVTGQKAAMFLVVLKPRGLRSAGGGSRQRRTEVEGVDLQPVEPRLQGRRSRLG